MGCSSSKLGAEDVVGRCKARKKLMKQAVVQRHCFAAAHSAYLLALRNTGAALRQFAEEEGGLPAASLSCGQAGAATKLRLPAAERPPLPPPLQLVDPSADGPKKVDSCVITAAVISSEALYSSYTPTRATKPGPLQLQQQKETIVHQTEDSLNIQVDGNGDPMKIDTKCGPPTEVEHSNDDAMTVDRQQAAHILVEEQEAPLYAEDLTNEDGGELAADIVAAYDMEQYDVARMTLRLGLEKDLLTIAKELDEEFLMACAGGSDASHALEAQMKPHVHTHNEHIQSKGPLGFFKWNVWSRSPVFHGEELERNVDDSRSNYGSLSLTLERLLAWEKKLFEEVKVVEGLRAQLQNKCSLLRCQETKADNAMDIEKTRAEIKRLHSLILVSYQGVNSKIEAIEDLRDDELHPQLISLVEGLKSMWMTMHGCHARQTQIIVHIKSLDAVMIKDATSQSHHEATIQLGKELTGWHESFCQLLISQRAYMAALYGWLKLSLLPIPTGKAKEAVQADIEEKGELDLLRLCEEWQRALGCLPDKVASEAISSMAKVVKAMAEKQGEEMKQRRRVEKLDKQWQKKLGMLQPLQEEEEEVSRVVMAGQLKRKVDGEMRKHYRAVQDTRVFSMNNLQTGLPGALEAMTGFSAVCCQAFQHLHALARFGVTDTPMTS